MCTLQGGFSSVAVGNCLLAYAGAVVCGDKVNKFPEEDGKNTYKLVSQGSSLIDSYRVHVSYFSKIMFCSYFSYSA